MRARSSEFLEFSFLNTKRHVLQIKIQEKKNNNKKNPHNPLKQQTLNPILKTAINCSLSSLST